MPTTSAVRRLRRGADLLAMLLLAGCLTGALIGCAGKPSTTQTGFLSDYSRLKADGSSRMVFASDRLATYAVFMVDPIELRVPTERLSPQDQAEAARYFRASAVRAIESQGLRVSDTPGVGVARVQIALTDVAQSTWWQKVHPVMRSLGAGTGGAAMEAQVIDSVTGEQLAAVVQSVSGNQFDFTAFSTLADVKSAIDKWTDTGSRELAQLRARTQNTR